MNNEQVFYQAHMKEPNEQARKHQQKPILYAKIKKKNSGRIFMII